MELLRLAEVRIREIIREEQAPLRSDSLEIKIRVSNLESDVAILKSDVAILKSDVAILKSDVALLKGSVATLQGDVLQIRADMTILKAEVSRIGICLDHMNNKLDKFLEVLT